MAPLTKPLFTLSLIAVASMSLITSQPTRAQGEGWTVLFDGKSLDHFDKVGDANWRIEDGGRRRRQGRRLPGDEERPYGDYQLRVEFWADEDVNSGIYMRCANPAEPTD